MVAEEESRVDREVVAGDGQLLCRESGRKYVRDKDPVKE